MRGHLEAFGVLAVALLVVVGALVGFTVAFARPLPTGAWAGFGVVIAVSVLLASVAALIVFGSDRPTVEPELRARSPEDGKRRILVVADEAVGAEPLRREICERALGCESEVLVVAPALNSPLRHWTDDEDRARAEAQARLGAELHVLAGLGVEARGTVGADDPLQAIDDALRTFPADEIVIATHPRDRVNWLEEGVVERARAAYGLPITHLVEQTA